MDQYGNPSLTDYMALKKGISAMNTNQKVGKFEDAQEELLGQHGTVQGVVENADPANMDQYHLKAYKGFSENYTEAMGAKRDSNVQKTKTRMMQDISKVGDPFSYFQTFQPTTEAEWKAGAELRELMSKNTNFQKQIFQNRAVLAKAKGTEAISIIDQAQTSLAKGDAATAGRLIEGMTRNIPMRGQYDFDKNTGLLHRKYLSRENGWQDTGETMSVQDFLKFAKGFSQQEFTSQVATQMKATSQYNREHVLKGGQEATGPKGERYTVLQQIDPNTFNNVHCVVFQDGKQVGVYQPEQLNAAGIKIRNMDQEKFEADLTSKKLGQQYTSQQIKTSKAAQKSHEANAKAKGAEVETKAAKERLKNTRDALSDIAKSLKSVKDGDGNTFMFADADSMDKMQPDDRKPFIQKVVEISNDMKYDHATRSAAKQYLGHASKLGYYVPLTQAQKTQKARADELFSEGKSRDEVKAIMQGEATPKDTWDTGSPPSLPSTSQTKRPVPAMGASVQVAQNQQPASDPHPFAAFKNSALVNKDGSIWGKQANGQPVRLMIKPPKKIRDGQGRVHDNPQYAKYLESLEVLGLAGPSSDNTMIANK